MKRAFFSIALALVLTRCGGDDSIASKSAAALREAQKQGKRIGPAEHGHGAVSAGQSGEVDHAAMGHLSSDTADHAAMGHTSSASQDHAAMGHTAGGTQDHAAMGHAGSASQDHAAMGHTSSASQDHAAMGHTTAAAQDHAAMNHGNSARGQDSSARTAGTHDHAAMGQPAPTQDHAAMGHGTTPARPGAHAGHGSASGVIPAGGLWGPVPGALVNPVAPASRESSAAPRLQRDALDVAVPAAVSEADKAAGAPPAIESAHEGHNQ